MKWPWKRRRTRRPDVELERDAGAEVLDRELSNHSGSGWDGWRYTVRPCA